MQYNNAKLITQLGNALVNNRNKVSSKFGLTSGQEEIMRFLLLNRYRGEITQSDVQNDMMLTHQTVSGMLSRLEEKGYIVCRQSETDKRYKCITVTSKAIELETALKEMAEEAESSVVLGMSEDEKEEFNYLLRTAYQNILGRPAKFNNLEMKK